MAEKTCPTCGEGYRSLGQHWIRGDCEAPDISDQQLAILDGLVLAGSHVRKGPKVHVQVSKVAFATWLLDGLDWLSANISEVHHETGTSYQISTESHPQLSRYETWPHHTDEKGRRPPEEYRLSPLAGRVWYSKSGWLQWSGAWDNQRAACLRAQSEEKATWIRRLLADIDELDLHPNRIHNRVQLSPTESNEWLEWIGEHVPGVAYKWCHSRIEYQALREEPETEAEYIRAVARASLQVACKRTDALMTPEKFDQIVDEVTAEQVIDWLGGSDWEETLELVGIPDASNPF